MQSTTTMLREEARVVPLGTAPDQLAATLDALAGYEQVALTSVATLMGDPEVAGLRTCIAATQDAADLAAVCRRVLARNTPAASPCGARCWARPCTRWTAPRTSARRTWSGAPAGCRPRPPRRPRTAAASSAPSSPEAPSWRALIRGVDRSPSSSTRSGAGGRTSISSPDQRFRDRPQVRGERGSIRSLMIRFWISLVPSKIVVSRASRQCRSTCRSVV